VLQFRWIRERAEDWASQQRAVPSWLVSLVFHLALFVLLAYLFTEGPPPGNLRERVAQVGITLKQHGPEGDYYQGESGSDTSADASPAPQNSVNLDQALDDSPPSDPTDVLPAAPDVIGPGALQGGGVGTAMGATKGGGAAGSPGRGGLGGARARTSVFGTVGEGSKFVYVFDRSGSTGGPGRNALGVAKAELLRSLEDLDKVHQFQIIFYNEMPIAFNPSGAPGKLAFGTPENKERAARFVRSITSDGGTRHDAALKLAIKMQPDVIFFFTDADEPRLSPRQLDEIHRWAGGITINAIEFGLGPKQSAANFLEKLARQNNGQYAYVDITRVAPAGSP